MDVQEWLIEILRGVGRLFLNPLFYWVILLLMISASRRINHERKQFGFKVFPMFHELKKTWLPSLVAGIFISVIFFGLRIVFPIPTLILLTLVLILLSVHMKFTLLSASYTLGLSYFLILLSPFLLQFQNIIDQDIFLNSPLMSMSLLLGILLMFEGFILVREERNNTYPELVKSERGLWIGRHLVKKLSIIPLFFLVPRDQLGSFSDMLPYFPIVGEQYSLILFPMIIGFEIPIRRKLTTHITKRMGLTLGVLGFFVAILAFTSSYLYWLSIVAVFLAILGREYVMYKHKTRDRLQPGFYLREKVGLRVLSVMPNSPADRLGILTGETITRVNGLQIHSVDEFYEALQRSSANYRLEVVDDLEENRIIQSALYAGEHYKLGLIFVDDPHEEMVLTTEDQSEVN